MARKKLRDAHWNLLLRRIHARRCVIFLGAGVNVGDGDYKGLPLGEEVTLKLLWDLTGTENLTYDDLVKAEFHEKLAEYEELTKIGIQDLARVALRCGFVNDKEDLVERLQEIINDNCEPSPILQRVSALPSRLIVTTNYDRLLEKALDGVEKKIVVQPTKGNVDLREWWKQEGALEEWKAGQERADAPAGPLVYKIHGSFDEDDPRHSPLVVTEEDYIEFLTVVNRQEGGIPLPIKGLMETSTLLFLGYSLEDWDFRTLYKGFVEDLNEPSEPAAAGKKKGNPKSIAIQKDPPEFWVEFWRDKGIEIYDIDLYKFSNDLLEKYQGYAKNKDG